MTTCCRTWCSPSAVGALFFGNGLALLRPPPEPKDGELTRAPPARTAVMMVIGLVATIWAVATLIS